jgi:CheY-like chemotaxis protein
MTQTPKIRVLVVNDQEPMNALWQQLIDATPDMLCVGLAKNGAEAVTLALELAPHVVVMDMMMPVMDGGEATRRIRAQLPDTLVIIYSAYNGMEERAYESGASEYLLMPIKPDKLQEVIRRVYHDHYNDK